MNTEEWCPAVDDKKEALERYRRVHKYVAALSTPQTVKYNTQMTVRLFQCMEQRFKVLTRTK